MTSINLYDNTEFNDFELTPVTEANGSSSDLGTIPSNVLSVIKGPAFVPDGYSRNGRFYPKELWEKVLNNETTKTAIDRKLMFGCIGHPTGQYSLDELLESGKVSHIVTSVEIKNGMGIAEYHILDTPAGRILNSVLSAGSKMYVSTRAFGGFTNGVKTHEGKQFKILDKNNFQIESIDFVINPGFLEADPSSLSESFKEDLLEMAQDPSGIKCEDGICSLAMKVVESEKEMKLELEKIDEVSKDIVDSKIIEEAEKFDLQDTRSETVDEAIDELIELDKESLIEMIKSISKENNSLLEKVTTISAYDKKDDEKDDSVSQDDLESERDEEERLKDLEAEKISSMKVKKRIFVSYIEMLYKLLKFDTNFENARTELMGVLDKDNVLTTEEVNAVKSICKTLADKSTDDSIKTLASKLVDLDLDLEAIAAADDGKDISNVVKAAECLVDDLINTRTKGIKESKADAITIQTLASAITAHTDSVIEKNNEVEMLKKTYAKLSEANADLTEKMATMAHNMSDMSEKTVDASAMESLTKSNEDLTEQYNTSVKTIEVFESKIDKAAELNVNMSIDLEESEAKVADLESQLSEMVSTDVAESLQNKLVESTSKVEYLTDEVDDFKALVETLQIENFAIRFPKLEKEYIVSIMNKFSENEDRINAFKSKEKRSVSIYEKPTIKAESNGIVYEDKKVDDRKNSFLERLI